jgi:hypothetical protein
MVASVEELERLPVALCDPRDQCLVGIGCRADILTGVDQTIQLRRMR